MLNTNGAGIPKKEGTRLREFMCWGDTVKATPTFHSSAEHAECGDNGAVIWDRFVLLRFGVKNGLWGVAVMGVVPKECDREKKRLLKPERESRRWAFDHQEQKFLRFRVFSWGAESDFWRVLPEVNGHLQFMEMGGREGEWEQKPC